MILPAIQIGIAVVIGTCSSLETISPPRSSKIGIMEMINTTISLLTYLPNVLANATAKLSIFYTPPFILTIKFKFNKLDQPHFFYTFAKFASTDICICSIYS